MYISTLEGGVLRCQLGRNKEMKATVRINIASSCMFSSSRVFRYSDATDLWEKSNIGIQRVMNLLDLEALGTKLKHRNSFPLALVVVFRH